MHRSPSIRPSGPFGHGQLWLVISCLVAAPLDGPSCHGLWCLYESWRLIPFSGHQGCEAVTDGSVSNGASASWQGPMARTWVIYTSRTSRGNRLSSGCRHHSLAASYAVVAGIWGGVVVCTVWSFVGAILCPCPSLAGFDQLRYPGHSLACSTACCYACVAVQVLPRHSCVSSTTLENRMHGSLTRVLPLKACQAPLRQSACAFSELPDLTRQRVSETRSVHLLDGGHLRYGRRLLICSHAALLAAATRPFNTSCCTPAALMPWLRAVRGVQLRSRPGTYPVLAFVCSDFSRLPIPATPSLDPSLTALVFLDSAGTAAGRSGCTSSTLLWASMWNTPPLGVRRFRIGAGLRLTDQTVISSSLVPVMPRQSSCSVDRTQPCRLLTTLRTVQLMLADQSVLQASSFRRAPGAAAVMASRAPACSWAWAPSC